LTALPCSLLYEPKDVLYPFFLTFGSDVKIKVCYEVGNGTSCGCYSVTVKLWNGETVVCNTLKPHDTLADLRTWLRDTHGREHGGTMFLDGETLPAESSLRCCDVYGRVISIFAPLGQCCVHCQHE
jgi:hypothetical protein